jgi:hypothetical protein
MKTFDSAAIKARMLERARINSNWSLISEDAVISLIFDSVSDSVAEDSRYMEYLLSEKKWDTAQNISSLKSMAKLVAYKPHRPKSATGTIIISHSDRLQNYGKTFFNLDDASDYDSLVVEDGTGEQENVHYKHLQSLRPYDGNQITVPKGTIFSSADGIEFITLETVTIRKPAVPYLETSWQGYKYAKVTAIQGKSKSLTIANSQGIPNETIVLPVNNCEDANTTVSEQFLSVVVDTTNAINFTGVKSSNEPWTRTYNILTAGPYDKVYEVYVSLDYEKVYFKFGDGINGQKLPKNSTVTIGYLETLGESGNISSKYKMTKVVSKIQDPNNPGNPNAFINLYSTNDTLLVGGVGFETSESIRLNAPIEYLNFYTIGTTDAFEKQIMIAVPDVAKVKVFGGTKYFSDLGTSKDVVYITAISKNDYNGSRAISDPDLFINTVIDYIGGKKSPTDTLYYTEPNFIKLKASVIIHTDDNTFDDETVKEAARERILSRYSIDNTDFKLPFYNSDLVTLASNADYIKYTETFIEAVSNVTFEDYDVTSTTGSYRFRLFFSFDTVFAADEIFKGFKSNFNGGVSYLLRIDLIWSGANLPRNRTLFLLDSRTASDDTNPEHLRTAQFPLIEFITDTKTMITKVIPLDQFPQEIKFFKLDANGSVIYDELNNPVKNVRDDTTNPGGFICQTGEVATQEESGPVEISFNEEYDVTSPVYARGYVDLPGDYLGFIPSSDTVTDFMLRLKDEVEIRVYAQPLNNNVIPQNWTDLVFTEDQEITVERNVVWTDRQ